MTAKEAWNSMMEGKPVRYKSWPENNFIYFDKKEYKIKNCYGIETLFYVSDVVEDMWEIYEEDERRNTMNFEEARRELLEGKKVRCVDWEDGKYIYFDDKNLLVKDNKELIHSYGIYDKLKGKEWELYEEPKKVIKVFISQPMHRRFKYEIIEERDKIKKLVEEKYGEDYQIEYLNENLWERPKDWTRIQNLGYSIMNMHNADIVVFAPGWEEAIGCCIEHEVALDYNKGIYVYIIKDDGKSCLL